MTFAVLITHIIHRNLVHVGNENLNRNSLHVETIPTHIWYRVTYDNCVLGHRDPSNVHIHVNIVIFTAATSLPCNNYRYL